MTNIVQLTNFGPARVVDGGTSREDALSHFLESRNARHILVQDPVYSGGRSAHFLRLPRLMKELTNIQTDLVVLNYPAYPFFWQHKVTPYFLMSLMFCVLLRRSADRRGLQIAIDIMDLPAYQYLDLSFKLEMSPKMLQQFDRFIFSRADRLWVCSNSLAGIVNHDYGIDESKLAVAVNGYGTEIEPREHPDSGPIRLAYAGGMNRERCIESIIDTFLTCGVSNAELHLCGSNGDWVRDKYADPRVIYHGSLTDREAGQVLSGCTIGLIPYPERGYYNLAFATKFSFYLGVGLPILCSNAHETASNVRRLGVGMCCSLEEFGEAFRLLEKDRTQIERWRERVYEVRRDFSWTSIYSRVLDEPLPQKN